MSEVFLMSEFDIDVAPLSLIEFLPESHIELPAKQCCNQLNLS